MSQGIKNENSNNTTPGDEGKHNMHYGANPKLFDLAEELRGRMT